ncbi:hypothetical protein Nepgr_021548 [Nepenthes gracilis]|uniref:peptidylprolyl isomerase n=1 Tax=Nepenthes gracilis TaxID=150966 RepID=A0AAD3XW14_NEPGR|nr:hypothetical protein Nepgr_021548 [Nepenthes gracilis]
MAFWGVEVKPGRPYTLKYEDVRGRLIIRQATLGIGSSTKKSILQCEVGEVNPVFLCTLWPDKAESCSLKLEFEEEEDVKFSVIGATSIHLAGIIQSSGKEYDQDDYEPDSYGEHIAETETEESSDYDSEDALEDDFFHDDMDMFPSSPMRSSGVVIEEIVDDGKHVSEDGKTKQLEKNLHESCNEEKFQRQIVPRGSNAGLSSQRESIAAPLLESEDEDGFPIISSHRGEPNIQKPEGNKDKNEIKRTSEEVRKKHRKKDEAKDDGVIVKGVKRKASTAVHDEVPKCESVQEDSSSRQTEIVAVESLMRRTKKKNQGRDAKAHETVDIEKNDVISQDKAQFKDATSGVCDLADQVLTTNDDSLTAIGGVPEEMKKKKKKKKGNNKDAERATNEEETISATGNKKVSTLEEGMRKTKARSSQVRTFANGLVIEEIEMGKPDGKRASAGKKVSVHYIGKLTNDQIFDSNIGRAPFKFRLGVGAVIKGWDVGVEGMRIGDKRRLTIPPSMGYGTSGAPPKVPPNAWLVFDVELVDVS